eukprot:3017040-Pleurochrysis_carterae.AAC.1
MPARNNWCIATRPSGRRDRSGFELPPPVAARPCRGSALRSFARVRFSSRVDGCCASRSPGRGSSAKRPSSSGTRLRTEANGAGVCRAASTAARTSPARAAPSAGRPPGVR